MEAIPEDLSREKANTHQRVRPHLPFIPPEKTDVDYNEAVGRRIAHILSTKFRVLAVQGFRGVLPRM